MIDVHADEAVADRLDEQRGDDRRIDAAGQRQQYLAAANLRTQGVDLFSNECVRLLGCRDAGHVFRTLVVFHVGNLRFNSIVFEEMCVWEVRHFRKSAHGPAAFAA